MNTFRVQVSRKTKRGTSETLVERIVNSDMDSYNLEKHFQSQYSGLQVDVTSVSVVETILAPVKEVQQPPKAIAPSPEPIVKQWSDGYQAVIKDNSYPEPIKQLVKSYSTLILKQRKEREDIINELTATTKQVFNLKHINNFKYEYGDNKISFFFPYTGFDFGLDKPDNSS